MTQKPFSVLRAVERILQEQGVPFDEAVSDVRPLTDKPEDGQQIIHTLSRGLVAMEWTLSRSGSGDTDRSCEVTFSLHFYMSVDVPAGRSEEGYISFIWLSGEDPHWMSDFHDTHEGVAETMNDLLNQLDALASPSPLSFSRGIPDELVHRCIAVCTAWYMKLSK